MILYALIHFFLVKSKYLLPTIYLCFIWWLSMDKYIHELKDGDKIFLLPAFSKQCRDCLRFAINHLYSSMIDGKKVSFMACVHEDCPHEKEVKQFPELSSIWDSLKGLDVWFRLLKEVEK